jgi:hypothetical protein
MDGAKEDLMDMFIVHTTEEVQVCGVSLFLYMYCDTREVIEQKLQAI